MVNSPTPYASRLIKVSKAADLPPDHFKIKANNYLCRFFSGPQSVIESQSTQPTLLHPQIPPKTARNHFFENTALLDYSDVGEAQKTDRKSLTGCRERVFWFSLKIAKKSVRQIHKCIYFSKFKCKGTFLSSSLDSLLSPASRDVFTDSIAQWFSNFSARWPPIKVYNFVA